MWGSNGTPLVMTRTIPNRGFRSATGVFMIMLSTVVKEVRLGEEFPCCSPNVKEV
jgi:hypothetical protein